MRTAVTPPPPPAAAGDDAIGAALAGVYAATPGRLLVGPLLHLPHFIQAPAGAAFGRTRLPAPSSRHVVDCAPHACDVPPLPRYATAASPTHRGSGVDGSIGASLRMSCASATAALAADAPLASPPGTPLAPTALDGATGGAAAMAPSSSAPPAVTHPAQMSLASRVRSPSPPPPPPPLAATNGHARSSGVWNSGSTPPQPLSRSPASTGAAAAVVDSLDVAHISTEEAVARMNSNASDFLEKLRQRCEVNGMAARGVSLVRRVNMVASPMQSSHSRAASPPAGAATALYSDAASPTCPTHADPMERVDLFASGSGVAESSAAVAGAGASQPEFTASSPVLSQLRHEPRATAASATIAPLPGINAALLRNAELNDEGTRAAEVRCGPDHVIACPVPHTSDSLDSPAVQAALRRITEVLASDPDAVVYVYSLDGKGTASAVAALYLVQVERVSLAEALGQRLPNCTPRMSCLVQLLERDPAPDTFDRTAYLRRYLARRHPTASVTSIEVAVEACKGDYAKAERLVRSELSFQAVEGVLAGRAAGRSGSGPLSGSTSASSPPLALGGSGDGGSPAAAHLRVGRAASRVSVNSALNVSLSSAAAARDALALTDGDETIIDSLHAALVDGGVAVTRAEVRESYVQHRRAQDMVLRQFLLRLKTAVTLSPPPRARPPRLGGGDGDGDATPPANALEPIELPHFAPASGSRQVSSTTTTPATVTTPRSRPTKKPQQLQRTVLKKVPAPFAHDEDGGASPEPRRPRVASARMPASLPRPQTPKKSTAGKAAPKAAPPPKAAAPAVRPKIEKATAAATTPKAKTATPKKATGKGRLSS